MRGTGLGQYARLEGTCVLTVCVAVENMRKR